jgi:hypothetical protein
MLHIQWKFSVHLVGLEVCDECRESGFLEIMELHDNAKSHNLGSKIYQRSRQQDDNSHFD